MDISRQGELLHRVFGNSRKLGATALRLIDEAMDCWGEDDMIEQRARILDEINRMPRDRPSPSEDDLMQGRLW